MAKAKEKEEDDPKEWTPAEPLEDDDAEKEANARAAAHARYEYLKHEHLKKLEKKGKPTKSGFSIFD